ncbi:MAG: hypothetical protein ABR562_03900 [Thermoplasmatota archaeon]|nr:hypothetical protein [Halobacteriales archaeon]
MAERQRKSKPRKEEPVEEDEKRYNWWQLAMYLVAAIGVIIVMLIVSAFLSNANKGPDTLLYWLFLGAVVLAGLLWLAGWLADRKTA